MKQKKSLTQKKGFYVALYSCLGVMLVFTAVFSFNNIVSYNNEKQELTQNSTINTDDLAATSSNSTQSYLEAAPAAPSEDASDDDTITSEDAEKEMSSMDNDVVIVPTEEQIDEAVALEEEVTEESASLPVEEEAIDSEAVFKGYNPNDKMVWPVSGEIVMDYSGDELVYDLTLDQYNTNEYIAISTNVGTPVKAASDGIVTDVYYDDITGTTVVIDDGNGWVTEYGQLQSNVLVSTGDYVQEGQVIGGVDYSTKSEVLLGNHLDFKVTNNGEPVDPKSVLEN